MALWCLRSPFDRIENDLAVPTGKALVSGRAPLGPKLLAGQAERFDGTIKNSSDPSISRLCETVDICQVIKKFDEQLHEKEDEQLDEKESSGKSRTVECVFVAKECDLYG